MQSANEMNHCKHVSALVIFYEGNHAGGIVAHYGDTGRVTATLQIWEGPLKMPTKTTRAGGGGYDKLGHCLERMLGADCPQGGETSVYSWMRDKGYRVIKAV